MPLGTSIEKAIREANMTTDQKFFEDFKVGDRYQSPSRTIHDGHFIFFAGLTGDNHPIHYDDEYCKQHNFGKRVAHGLLVTAMTVLGGSNLSHEVEDSMLAFVSQSSRFLKPVFIGDTIYPELEVSELIDKKTRGIMKCKTVVKNQDGDVVIEGEHVYLIKKRSE
jgi:acyl dehydratase